MKNNDIKIKSRLLIENEIIPIICVGETLRSKRKILKQMIFSQLEECLPESQIVKNTYILLMNQFGQLEQD